MTGVFGREVRMYAMPGRLAISTTSRSVLTASQG